MYVNGSGVSSNGAIYFLSGNNTYSGAIVLQSNSTMTSAAGNQTFSGTIDGAYDLTITAAAAWTQSGAIGGSSALADYSLTASSGNVTTNAITANGSINIFGVDITVSSGTLTAGSNEDVILSASGNFINNSGASVLNVSGTGRWIVYATDDDSSTFNSLDSSNTPLWSATYSTLSPSSVPSGNRYVFAETSSQTVTFTTTSETITYADSYDLSDNYVITTSGVAGLANVYDITSSGSQITVETAYSSNPTVTVSANSASNSTSGNLEAGSYTLGISVAGGTLRSGYTLATSEAGTITVNQKSLTLSGITAANKTYDGDNTSTIDISSAAFAGLVASDVVSVSATGTFSDANVGTGKTVTLSETMGGTDIGNYSVTAQGSTTSDITAKTLTATADAADKTYDGTTTATVTLTLSGVVGSDSVSSTTGATFSQSDVGTGLTATVNSITLTGDDASNYTISAGQTDTAAITAKTLTATADAADKTYDGTNAATVTLTLSGVVGSDSVSSTNGATFSQSNVGTGITATVNSITLTGDDAGNYTISSGQTDTAAITAKTLTATADAADKTYDGTNAATVTITLSGLVGAETLTASETSTFAQTTVGTGITVTVDSISLVDGTGDADNYSISSGQTDTAAITAKTLTATADAADKTYDGTTTATVTLTLSGVVGSDSVSSTTGATFSQSDVGTGLTATVNSITLTGDDASNYTISAGQTDTAAITAKTLTATADAADKTYDGTNAATVTLTLSGVVGSDSVSSTNGATFSQSNVGTGITATVNSITLTGDDAGNYTISSGQTDTAAITAKTLTATADAADKTYDGTNAATVTITLSGLVGAETLTASETSTFAQTTVGTGITVTVDSISLVDGTGDADNYSISSGQTDTAAITAKTLTATADAADKTYDGTTTATVTLTLSGVVGSDSVSSTTGATFSQSDVGTGLTATVNSITLTGDDASNYTISAGQTDTADITQKALGYTVDASNKTYDGTDAATVTLTLNRLVTGETLTATAIGTFDSANVGTRTATVNTITLTDGTGDADNYSISTGGTDSASITQKALTYTVDANDKTYDGTRSATATLSLSGLVGSETLDVTNTATFANATAGDDKTVTVTSVNLADGTNGGLAANYSISSGETTTATINKATLNVAPLDDAKFVGEADPAGFNGVIYNGFISGESSSDLGGSTTISRNAGETAGDYTLSLTQTLTSDNYTINFGTGTFTIAATTAILVDLVQNNTLYYGSDPTYGSGQSHTISARDIDGALTVTMSGQEATITKSGTTVAVAPLVPNAATSSTAGYYKVGGYNYSVNTADANYSLADGYSIVVDSGEYNITPLEIDVNATVTVGGLTKTYDGNANISGLTTTISSSPVKTGMMSPLRQPELLTPAMWVHQKPYRLAWQFQGLTLTTIACQIIRYHPITGRLPN